jgi:hypothetical protein
METFYIALLPVLVISYFMQGTVAPRRLLIAGLSFLVIALVAAFVGVTTPAIRGLAGVAADVLAYGCGLLGLFGILLAVPALSDMIRTRRSDR